MTNTCRCCNTAMMGSDHCPRCFCEEFEERCSPVEGFRHSVERAMDATFWDRVLD